VRHALYNLVHGFEGNNLRDLHLGRRDLERIGGGKLWVHKEWRPRFDEMLKRLEE